MENIQAIIKWPCPNCKKEQGCTQIKGTFVECSVCKTKFFIYLQEVPSPPVPLSSQE